MIYVSLSIVYGSDHLVKLSGRRIGQLPRWRGRPLSMAALHPPSGPTLAVETSYEG